MKNWWSIVLVLIFAGCQFNETPTELSLTGGPTLQAFPKADGIGLVWNNYILPYYVQSGEKNTVVSYHILISEIGPGELSEIAEVTENAFGFSSSGESPYWFAIDAEYSDGSLARSNIVMSSSSLAMVTPINALESLEFSAGYSELLSGTSLFQTINSLGESEIKTMSPSGNISTLTTGRNPVPHPQLDQFLYLSDPDNLASSPSNTNSLLVWNGNDSSVIPLVYGSAYIDKPSWDHDGQRIVYLTSIGPGEPTTTKIVTLDITSTTVALLNTGINGYSGAGIVGPNYPSFFPEQNAIVMDIPSIDRGSIGRNILLKPIDGALDSLLVQSPWMDTQPSVHPSGRTMVFVSDRAGSPAIWELEFSTGDLRQLTGRETDPIVSREYPLHWSVDGSVVWYTGIFNDHTSCYQIQK